MGTSNSNSGTRGSGTPLIPSWIDSPGGNIESIAPETPRDNETPQSVPEPITAGPPIPPPAVADRFTIPRTNLSKFARSGGGNRSAMGRAVAEYVSKSTGGAKNAARKMGSSRIAGRQLLTFLLNVTEKGIQDTLRSLKLDTLSGKPILDVFLGISDFVCPEGGDVDANIAREAYFETIAELASVGVTDFERMTAEQIQTIFELFTTNAIEARILNDIGNKVISVPSTPADSINVQELLKEFIRNSVADALATTQGLLESARSNKALAFVDEVYEKAFTLLRLLGNAEGGGV